MVRRIITHHSAETRDCCEKQCMAGFCSVRNTAPEIQYPWMLVKALYGLQGHHDSNNVLTGYVLVRSRMYELITMAE